MVKNYYLTYAIKSADLDKTGQRIGNLLEMQVVPHASSFVGNYVICEGSAADRLTIEVRNRKYFPPDVDYKQYGLILFAQNAIGKNVDKELRHSQLKTKLAKLPELLLLEEKVEESKN